MCQIQLPNIINVTLTTPAPATTAAPAANTTAATTTTTTTTPKPVKLRKRPCYETNVLYLEDSIPNVNSMRKCSYLCRADSRCRVRHQHFMEVH